MSEDALFNLRWDAQRSALLGSMGSLFREEAFVDATIVSDTKIYKAHKLLLSASSSYLKHILESVPSSQHAVLFLPQISAVDLGNVLKFIYDGEIKINKRYLRSFLSVAKLLKIKGMDFELNEDLDAKVPLTAQTSILSASVNPHKRHASESLSAAAASCANDEDISIPPAKTSSLSKSNNELASQGAVPRNNEHSPNASSCPASSGSDEECNNSSSKASKPASIGSHVRSKESLSSQASNSNKDDVPPPPASQASSCEITKRLVNGNNNDIIAAAAEDSSTIPSNDNEDSNMDSSMDISENNLDYGNKALNLRIVRSTNDNDTGRSILDTEAENSKPQGEDSSEEPLRLCIPETDMDDDYEEDDEQNFSISIQPEVSLKESDESFSISDRRPMSIDFKPFNFSSSGGGSLGSLPIVASPSMSITPAGSSSTACSPLSLQQQLSLKHLAKPKPIISSKGHHQGLPGQLSPQTASLPGLNEGILMRMMREPLQTAPGKQIGAFSPSALFDAQHSDSLHSSGIRKQKRYVQCNNCSKVLSSLSALKRHMEDVHCARIQGKCLLCGRVYSSRNSLLTHVYSAHKKHHDYKAVARIIRESDFEQFATA